MVKPKRKKLIAAEEALKMAEKRLASKQESLKKVGFNGQILLSSNLNSYLQLKFI